MQKSSFLCAEVADLTKTWPVTQPLNFPIIGTIAQATSKYNKFIVLIVNSPKSFQF